jgi:dTDP-4-dehydrorhamnose reductase
MSPKILLFGGRGWIGGQIADVLREHKVPFEESQVRVDDYEELMNELKRVKPTHVVSTIGRTSGYLTQENGEKVLIPNIDYLEYPGKLVDNVHDNLYGPILLARATQELGIHFTYMGTGCIFEYDSQDHDYKFTEQDKPNFFGSSYSIVKGFTDSLMKTFNNVLNVRIRMPITYKSHPKDFITKISEFSKICSIPNSMTVLDDLLPVMVEALLRNETGTLNLVNPGVISHNEILTLYKQLVKPDHEWETVPFSKLNHLKSSRSNNWLNTDKLETEFPGVPDIATSIAAIMEHRHRQLA